MANYIQQKCLQFHFSIIMMAKILRYQNFPYYGFSKLDTVMGLFQFTEFKCCIDLIMINIWFWSVGNAIHEDVLRYILSHLNLTFLFYSHPGSLIRLGWATSFNKFIMQILCFREAWVTYFFVAPEIQRTSFYL